MHANARNLSLAFIAATLLATAPAARAADAAGTPQGQSSTKNKLIIQVSDGDSKKWSLALNNAKNVQQDLGRDQVEIEIVAYGPGLAMLKLDSEAGGRVAEAIDDGVRLVACENTMTSQKLTREDMLPRIGYVKAGVVELMQKQQQGYAYIRP